MLIDSIAGCHLDEFEERLAIKAPTCHSMLPVGMFALDITGSTTQLALHSTKHQQLKCSGHHFWWGMRLRRLRARLSAPWRTQFGIHRLRQGQGHFRRVQWSLQKRIGHFGGSRYVTVSLRFGFHKTIGGFAGRFAKRRRSPAAVSRLLYPESPPVKWPFHLERANLQGASEGGELWNCSNSRCERRGGGWEYKLR